MNYTVLSLFDGIGCGYEALKRIVPSMSNIKYIASEIDQNAIRVAHTNHPDILHIGDVKNIRYVNDELWTDTLHHQGKIDLVIAGSPCQGLSKNGKLLLLDDPRSGLYYEFLRLMHEINPEHFLLENVCMPRVVRDKITEDMKVFNGNIYTINSNTLCAQNRVRLYWTNIPQSGNTNMNHTNSPLTMQQLIGDGYTGIWCRPHGFYKGGYKLNMEKAPCITRSGWLGSFFVCKGEECRRKFTAEECEQLQTLPVGYTAAAGSDHARVSLIGNSWTVDVVSVLLLGALHSSDVILQNSDV